MTPRPMRPRLLTLSALVLASSLALAGCGGGDDEPKATSTPTATPTESPSESGAVAIPEGTETTPPGTPLAFGDTATVAYELKGEGTVLDLTVNSATKGALADFSGFNMDDPYRKRANYYYVRVTVKNVGEDTFGSADVPLWGISGENTLLPIVKFTSAFKKCPTQPLPAEFAPDDEFKTCLVFLSPNKGSLEGVSYRPTEDFVPIEWRGEVTVPKKPKAEKSG